MENEEMEVDRCVSVSNVDDDTPLLVASNANTSVTVFLHPLVIMNVSEHWTRIRAQEGGPKRVVGALMGKQVGREVDIMNSFELILREGEDADKGVALIDETYYYAKENQFQQVFPDVDIVGWYTTDVDSAPTEWDVRNHKEICAINEGLLLLKLNPYATGPASDNKLPFILYESVNEVNNENSEGPVMLFVEVQCILEIEDAERIGIDHMARTAQGEDDEMAGGERSSSILAKLSAAQYNAVKMLHGRVKLLLEYVKAVRSGELPRDRKILQKVFALLNRLPATKWPEFDAEFYTQFNDVALITYLGSITKCCYSLHELSKKFSVLYGEPCARSIGRIKGR